MQIQLTLPDDIALGLKIPTQAIKEDILKEIAFLFYAQGKASLGIARRISGLDKREFLAGLAQRKIPRHYSEKDLEVDLKYAKSSQ